MRVLVKECWPGSGAMASQLDAEIVSVMLLPFGKVALAAPAQQSSKIRTSEVERSSRVWIADHLRPLLNAVVQLTGQRGLTVTRESRDAEF